MSRWNLAWLLGVTATAVVGIALTFGAPAFINFGITQGPTAKKTRHDNLRLLVDVLDEVQKKYVKELDQDKMRELVENMVNGGLEKLDPHSGFIGVDEYKAFRQSSRGKFGGVGIRLGVDPRTGQFMVESPMPGTPAYEAGVMAGDLILKVDGKSLENWNLKKVVEAIQGDPGTEVTLTVVHDGAKQTVDLKMNRAEIKVESVMGDHRSKIDLKEWDFWVEPVSKIAYIRRLTQFGETTVDELTRVVDALQKAGMKGLIVDLRNNPGGLLRAAVEVSSLFLTEGKHVVSTKGRGNVVEETYNARLKNGMVPGAYPMAILLNRYSASASEIVAAALQDHGRAVIIGERSYGKGSVQNLIEMEERATALKITTASYWRPSGLNIHRFPDSKETDDWGVKPDKGFDIKLTDEERLEYFKWRRERDIIRRPNEEQPKAKENGDKKDKKEFRDRVLDKAVEHLKAEIEKKNQQGQAPAPQVNPAAQAEPALLRREPAFAEVADRAYRNVVR